LRQPDGVRAFLLQTSILGRMNGSLCDAVTGRDDSRVMLETLDRANLFLVPLDDRRRWYRYHHLFADVLRARLLDERPDDVPELHRRASAWHAERGEHDEAIQHALAAEDFPLAASLIERALPALTRDRREVTLRGWLETLPVELFRVRPVLSLAYVGALLSTGTVDGVEPRLRDAEHWLDETGNVRPQAVLSGMVVADEEESRRLPATTAIYRAGLALALGNPEVTEQHARRALNLLEEGDDFRRGAASALVGLAVWGGGDLESAYTAYAEATACFRRSGYLSDVLGCTVILADIRLVQGRLGDALDVYERALQLALEQPRVLRGTPDMHVGISTILRERGLLEAAAEHLRRSQDLGEHTGMPKHRYRWRVALAELRLSSGDATAAAELLDEAERFYVPDMAPNVRPVPASRARAWLAQGSVVDALGWARDQGLSVEDDLSYVREFGHVTLARILLARHRLDRDERTLCDALGLLSRLLDAAESGGRGGTALEILVLQSLAHQLSGDTATALAALERALAIGEPEGYVRVFVDEGAPMEALLKALPTTGKAGEYARRLLAMFGGADTPGPARDAGSVLVEPLSEREREVLRLLDTDLTGPEIARQLVVSLNTVRTHTKSIYAKLGVNNRRAAVRRAEELGQFTRGRPRPS
ncbi:MAG: LuxR C-terminal-related transcriptional regulator, partial [Actinomycetota bacterium]|nr:LuxR C-terminal-related transcriptional regulator [Actinomycetota bacterium]